jgi:hypothetical protein
MTLELTPNEIVQLKSLIFDEIDRVGGFNELNFRLQAILKKLSDTKRSTL